MIKLFPGLFWTYMGAALGGALTIIVLTQKDVFLACLLSFLWITACVWLFQFLAKKKYAKIMALRDNCRLEECASCYEKLLKRAPRRDQRFVLQMNLVTLYLDMGQTEKARQILYSADNRFPNKKRYAHLQPIYWNQLCALCLLDQDYESAQNALERMELAAESKDLPPKARAQVQEMLQLRRAYVQIAQGNAEGAEELLTKALEVQKAPLGKAAYQYWLGRVYLLQQEPEKARQAWRYVAENGKNSVYTCNAREELEALEADRSDAAVQKSKENG